MRKRSDVEGIGIHDRVEVTASEHWSNLHPFFFLFSFFFWCSPIGSVAFVLGLG